MATTNVVHIHIHLHLSRWDPSLTLHLIASHVFCSKESTNKKGKSRCLIYQCLIYCHPPSCADDLATNNSTTKIFLFQYLAYKGPIPSCTATAGNGMRHLMIIKKGKEFYSNLSSHTKVYTTRSAKNTPAATKGVKLTNIPLYSRT